MDGAYIDSRGHNGIITWVGSIGDVLKADCNLKHQDGDISYLDAYREIGGADGVSKMSGGTGKYQNVSANCVYQIAASNQNVSVGLVTDEEEEENALGGARLEFVPIGLNDGAIGENNVTEGKLSLIEF